MVLHGVPIGQGRRGIGPTADQIIQSRHAHAHAIFFDDNRAVDEQLNAVLLVEAAQRVSGDARTVFPVADNRHHVRALRTLA